MSTPYVALQFGMAMNIPNIWLAEHEIHVFLVLADESKLKNDLSIERI